MERPVSSGSEGGEPVTMDERKRKRMLSNRESARRSRMRKQKQMEELTEETQRLGVSNKKLVESIAVKEEAFVQMEAANSVLRVQTMELADRLRFLNSILEIAEEVGGMSLEIPEIPDPLLRPWQIPHQIMASTDMFLC